MVAEWAEKKTGKIRKKVLTKGFRFGIVAKRSAGKRAAHGKQKIILRNGEKTLDKSAAAWYHNRVPHDGDRRVGGTDLHLVN